MSEVYVVTNQDGYFVNKHKEWLDGRDTKLLFRSNHKDEAINLVFELSSKDINVRASALLVALDDKNQPIVEVTVPLVVKPVAPEESEELSEQTVMLEQESSEPSSDEPKELSASERLSQMAARLRQQQEA